MLSNEAKQFGIYLLGQVLPPVANRAGDHTAVVNTLATTVPGLDVSAYRAGITAQDWQEKLCPQIVNHFADRFEPGKLKATA